VKKEGGEEEGRTHFSQIPNQGESALRRGESNYREAALGRDEKRITRVNQLIGRRGKGGRLTSSAGILIWGGRKGQGRDILNKGRKERKGVLSVLCQRKKEKKSRNDQASARLRHYRTLWEKGKRFPWGGGRGGERNRLINDKKRESCPLKNEEKGVESPLVILFSNWVRGRFNRNL